MNADAEEIKARLMSCRPPVMTISDFAGCLAMVAENAVVITDSSGTLNELKVYVEERLVGRVVAECRTFTPLTVSVKVLPLSEQQIRHVVGILVIKNPISF